MQNKKRPYIFSKENSINQAPFTAKRWPPFLFLAFVITSMTLSAMDSTEEDRKNAVTTPPEPVAFIQVSPDRLEMTTKPGCRYEQPIMPKFIRPHGDDYSLHLDLPGQNFLPPEIAAPGAPIRKPDAPPGGSSLKIESNTTWRSPNIPVKHNYTLTSKAGFIFSAYVRAVDKKIEAPVTINLIWRPKDKTSKEVTTENTIKAGNTWRRTAVVLENEEKKVNGNVQIEISSPSPIEIGGLQLEPWRDYPAYLEEPTAWMPGGSRRIVDVPATFPASLIPMDWSCGAVSLRVRIPDVFGDKASGTRTLLFVAKFWGGILELNTQTSRIGKTILNTKDLQKILADGKEHMVVLTWNDKQAIVYADGKSIAQAQMKNPVKLDPVKDMDYRIWIGTHQPRRRTTGGEIRDLRFFDQFLTQSDVTKLENTPRPTFAKGLLLTPPARNVFRRNEDATRLKLPLSGVVPAKIEARLDGIPESETRIIEEGGKSWLEIMLKPWLCSKGERKCAIVLTQQGQEILRIPWTIYIMEAEPRDRYTIGNWGGEGTIDALRWAKELGLSLVDSRNTSAAYLNQVGHFGLRASANFRNIRQQPHPTADKHMEILKLEAKRLAKAISPFPWVVTCVHNSEGFGTDDVTESTVASQALKDDLGVATPPLPSQAGWSDLAIRPKVDLREFNKTGIVPDDYLPLRYIKWLLCRGDGMNTTSAITASEIKALSPHTKMVQEPARQHYASWADKLSNWRYANTTVPMLTVWKQGLSAARSAGKCYYPLTGHCYYSPRIFLGENRKIEVPPSGDMASAFLWAGLAMPADEVRCFGWWRKNWEKNERLRPGTTAQIKKTIADISRLGPIVGNVPFKPAPLAVFVPETNALGRAGEEWYHAYRKLVYDVVNIFGEHDLQIDFLTENQVLNGELDHYQYAYAPALRYQLSSVNKVIKTWRKKGGTLILDNLANPAFAADMTAQFAGDRIKGMAFSINTTECEKWVDSFRRKIHPYARLERGEAILLTKEHPGTQFVFAINNKWKEAIFNKQLAGTDTGSDIIDEMKEFEDKGLKKKLSAKLMDVGVGHTATISLLETPDATVYDLKTGKRLDFKVGADKRLVLDLPLEPGSATVLAVYQTPPKKLVLDVPTTPKSGTITEVKIKLLDANGKPLQGRQGIDVEISDPTGRRFDASGIYRLEDGQTTIKLRLPLDCSTGTWRMTGKHLASSLKATVTFDVSR